MRLAVLATIVEKPGWGYDIARRFEDRFGTVLGVTDRRVYQVVEGLLADGLVEVLSTAPRRVFGATDHGLDVHRQWLSEALIWDGERTAAQVGVLAASVTDPHEALAMLDQYERVIAADLASVRPVIGNVQGELLARMKRMVGAAHLQWIAYARERLRKEA